MKVLVTGGRTYTNMRFIYQTLDELEAELHMQGKRISLVMSGNASGADSHARSWAMLRKKSYVGYPAPWKQYGNRAGPIRNTRMLVEGKPDIVLAFKGHTGTADMCQKAAAAAKKGELEFRDLRAHD